MLKIPLQRYALALVLLFGTVAVLSSVSSCRRIDVLDPNDHGKDTNNHRDTTIVRDTNNTDTTIVRDTNFVDDSGMVVNGGFDQNPGTFLPIPSPWEVWSPLRTPPMIMPQWTQNNGCGSGFGSIEFFAGTETGVGQEMNSPFLQNHAYNVSFCADVMPADSSGTASAVIDIRTSQDGGLTFTSLATFHTNAIGWASYSKNFTCPIDSKTIYIVVSSFIHDSWVMVDNVKVRPQ